MNVKVGEKLASTVCAARFVVVAAPAKDIDLRCGGAPVVSLAAGEPVVVGPPDPAHASGSVLGKRYADADLGLELICTQAGEGSLSADGQPVELKAAKPLPSSD